MNLNWREQHLYGSNRIGMWTPNLNLTGTVTASMVWDTAGHKQYELTNHLGNVLATISDLRTLSGGVYHPTVTSAQDYYAFGGLQPGRTYTLSGSYRYGFNGKENDNEVKGPANEQDYGMRIYDPRVGRFLSMDPLTQKFAWYTPYQFTGNNPIQNIDLDGAEEVRYNLILDRGGNTKLKFISSQEYIIHSLFGVVFDRFKIPERYIVNYNDENYYIGFTGSNGTGNTNAVSLFNFWKNNLKDAKSFGELFYSEAESRRLTFTAQLNQALEAARNTLSVSLLTGLVKNPDGTYHQLGQYGTQTPSKTVWKQKGSSARIDVENPNPGQRPGTLHYQDSSGNKYQYSVDENKFYEMNPETKQFDTEAPNSVNDLLKNKEFKNGVIKGLKYLGEQPKM